MINSEFFFNDQRAELYALRLILQILLSRLLDMTGQGPEALADIEQEATTILKTPIPLPEKQLRILIDYGG